MLHPQTAMPEIVSSSEEVMQRDMYMQYSSTDYSSDSGYNMTMPMPSHVSSSYSRTQNNSYSPPLSLDMRADSVYTKDSGNGSIISASHSSHHTAPTSESSHVARSESDSSRGSSTYKFKNHIKLRFTADEEDGERSLQDMMTPASSPVVKDIPINSSATSMDLNSSADASGSLSRNSSPIKEDNCKVQDSATNVPGFALHPSGTHYFPVVMGTSHIQPYLNFSSSTAVSSVCHPISIPVVFSGPTFMSGDCNGSSASGPTPATCTVSLAGTLTHNLQSVDSRH